MTNLLPLAKLTLQDPRKGLRALLQTDPPMGVRLTALVLMAVGTSLMMHLSLWLAPMPAPNPLIEMLISTPFTTAAVQAAVLLMSAGLIYQVGRVWGGKGAFDEAVLAIVWLQVFLLALQAVQLVALLAIPVVAVLIGPLSLVLFLWLLTLFIAEMHGFRSAGKVLLGIVLTIFAVSFLAVFVIIAILGPEGMPRV